MNVHGVYDTSASMQTFYSRTEYQTFLQQQAGMAGSAFGFYGGVKKAWGSSSLGGTQKYMAQYSIDIDRWVGTRDHLSYGGLDRYNGRHVDQDIGRYSVDVSIDSRYRSILDLVAVDILIDTRLTMDRYIGRNTDIVPSAPILHQYVFEYRSIYRLQLVDTYRLPVGKVLVDNEQIVLMHFSIQRTQ